MGAPRGNQNARTHGLSPRGLEQSTQLDLSAELADLRYFYHRLADLSRELTDPLQLAEVLRVLTLASAGITRLVRTQLIVVPIDQVDYLLEFCKLTAKINLALDGRYLPPIFIPRTEHPGDDELLGQLRYQAIKLNHYFGKTPCRPPAPAAPPAPTPAPEPPSEPAGQSDPPPSPEPTADSALEHLLGLNPLPPPQVRAEPCEPEPPSAPASPTVSTTRLSAEPCAPSGPAPCEPSATRLSAAPEPPGVYYPTGNEVPQPLGAVLPYDEVACTPSRVPAPYEDLMASIEKKALRLVPPPIKLPSAYKRKAHPPPK